MITFVVTLVTSKLRVNYFIRSQLFTNRLRTQYTRALLELGLLETQSNRSVIMISYNITPYSGIIDDPARLKQMALVKAPLKTKFDGKPDHLRTHIQEFTRRMKNTGLYQEFQIRTQENERPEDIPEDEWTQDHPLRWQTANFLDNFLAVNLAN